MVMKTVFVFTNNAIPETRVLENVTKIETVTESDIDKFQITQSDSTVTKYPATSGQLAIFWE